MQTVYTLSLLPLLLTTGSGLITRSALADSYQPNDSQQIAQAIDDIHLLLPDMTAVDGLRLRLSDAHEIIFADGSEYEIDLSGQDGRNASHPKVRGRAGEAGEDGGTLTVYYTDLADLRNIYVDASGGEGGAGLPGSTTYRCPPPHPSWEDENNLLEPSIPDVEINLPPELPPEIQNQINQSSTSVTKDFDPNDIRIRQSPRPGCTPQTSAPGPTGKDGRPGQLRIVNREELVPPETPETSATLAELIEQPVDLSKHLWRERQGAADLLAPGSIIADEYQEYVEQLAVTAQLQWEADSPLSDFETAQATLYLK